VADLRNLLIEMGVMGSPPEGSRVRNP